MHDTKDIEDALVALLRQIIKERGRPPGPFRITPMRFGSDVKIKTREQAAVDRIIESPVEAACLLAVRLLGQRVHDLGVEMIDVADRVCARSRRYGDHWLAILNSRWDGIGHWWA